MSAPERCQSRVSYPTKPPRSGSYVYVFFIEGVAAYVGRGIGDRLFHHEAAATNHASKTRWQSALGRALAKGARVEGVIVVQGLTVSEANEVEISLIAQYGRRDLKTGTLHNRTAGGDGMSSEDAKRQWEDPGIGWRLQRKRAQQAKDAITRARLALGQRQGWTNPHIRERRVAAIRETMRRPGLRAKMIATCAITNQRPDVKARRSDAAKKLHRDPIYRLKLCEALRVSANRPERIALYREQMTAQNQDPEFTRKRLAGIQKYWQRQREARRMSTQNSTPKRK